MVTGIFKKEEVMRPAGDDRLVQDKRLVEDMEVKRLAEVMNLLDV
jgi:hypothetical protein